jgi:hypothetical protein
MVDFVRNTMRIGDCDITLLYIKFKNIKKKMYKEETEH